MKIKLYLKRFLFLISKIKEYLCIFFINPLYPIKVNSYIPNPKNISFPVKIGYGAKINSVTKIGKYVSINDDCIIMNNVKSIGAYSSISDKCYLGIQNHPVHLLSTHSSFYTNSWGENFLNLEINNNIVKDTVIAEDVWMGYNSKIKSGCKVARGTIVSADSFLKNDTEPYSIWRGNPAQKIGLRFNEKQIIFLEKSEWWKKDLKEAKKIFDTFQKKNF